MSFFLFKNHLYYIYIYLFCVCQRISCGLLVVSLYHMGLENQIQAIRTSVMCLYLQCHLACFHLFYKQVSI